MTGHHAGHKPRAHQPTPADPLLDQLAQHVTVARASGNAAVASLAEAEATFTAGVLSRLEEVDAPTVGAVLLAAGYYAGEFLKTLVGTDGPTAAASTINVIQLAGQQLYTSRIASKAVCGLPWPSGKPCTQAFEADDDETLAAKMRGHVALAHPGQEWSAHVADEPEPRAMEPVAPGEYDLTPGEAVDAMSTGLAPVGSRSQPEPPVGRCAECGSSVYLDSAGKIGIHPIGPAGTMGRCEGIGTEPVQAPEAADQRPSPLRPWSVAIGGDLPDAEDRLPPQPKHAPYEPCDCRPGETYHCAAAPDGEVQS